MKFLIAFTILLFAALIAPSTDASPDCAENEVYTTCGNVGCQPTCAMSLKGTKCIGIIGRCGHGCYCKDGYVRLSSEGGRCVLIADCAQYDSSN
ncbi:chymotrypsin inhibitor-like [Hermetia illucens]|uniref:chymotrypsin inhibitor-like n=1 Tax=Hermetia illucens TaxID=343691 RepID=UPI0018CC4339|nr:chymotrypsin inhibitor-like [Hermetia illucens]